jgi:hypothetical protein
MRIRVPLSRWLDTVGEFPAQSLGIRVKGILKLMQNER